METSSLVDASTGNGTELERCFAVGCGHEVMYSPDPASPSTAWLALVMFSGRW